MSTALRLLNFTFECLLDPHARGERPCLTDPGSPGGRAACLTTPSPRTVGRPSYRERRADIRQVPETRRGPSPTCDLDSGMPPRGRNNIATTNVPQEGFRSADERPGRGG